MRTGDPRVERLRDALFESDPLADAVVAWMEGLPDGAGRQHLDRMLEHGPAGPVPEGPLTELRDELERVPPWLDTRLVRIGTDTMLRLGRGGVYALGGSCLMSGYLSLGAVKPLIMTGALTKMARRRLAETASFIRDLATSGDLGRSSAGFKTTVRVRIMHAVVRAGLMRSSRWRTEDWGLPINQRDMVGTHLEFTVAFIGGVSALGYLLSAEEREALIHLWRYVATLIGARDALIPTSFQEALELAWIFDHTETGPDDDGRALAAALLEAWSGGGHRGGLRARFEGPFLTGYSRLILGRKAADGLRLPDNAWKYAPFVVAPARASLELLRMIVPGGQALAVSRGRAALEEDVERGLEGRPHHFRHAVSS